MLQDMLSYWRSGPYVIMSWQCMLLTPGFLADSSYIHLWLTHFFYTPKKGNIRFNLVSIIWSVSYEARKDIALILCRNLMNFNEVKIVYIQCMCTTKWVHKYIKLKCFGSFYHLTILKSNEIKGILKGRLHFSRNNEWLEWMFGVRPVLVNWGKLPLSMYHLVQSH